MRWSDRLVVLVLSGGLLGSPSAGATTHDIEVILGATNIHAAIGNGRITAAFSRRGELTVLRWPNPTFHEHLHYATLGGVDATSLPRFGAQPNHGGLDGVVVSGKVSWLRDAPWTSRVRYSADDTNVVVREWTSGARTVTCTDVVQGDLPVLRRRCALAGDGLTAYVGYLNPALMSSHVPIDPTIQTVFDDKREGSLRWDAALRAFVDVADGVALVVGVDPAPEAIQCGRDDGAGPADAFVSIEGSTASAGRENLAFRVAGAAAETIIAFGATEAEAIARLADARSRAFGDVVADSEAESRAFLATADLPKLSNADLDGFVRRTVLSVRTGSDPDTGAVVASVSSQPPYNLDWPRDGTFFNLLFERLGFRDRVEKHNAFYVAAQRTSDGEKAFDPKNAPAGSWAMNYYSDLVPGGPIDFEIDQTGFLLWTLATHTPEGPGVFAAIRRAADLLVACRDPETGLQCPASEDDHYEKTQTLHGAITVWMGLQAAVDAARAAGEAGWELWDARRVELEAAIRARYIRDDGIGDEGVSDGALSWAIWPARFPMTAAAESAAVQRLLASLETSILGEHPDGSAYDAKLTLALAWLLATPSPDRDRLDVVLTKLATAVPTEDTRHLGEVYIPNGDGTWSNHTSQPHLWEATLVTLSLLMFHAHPDTPVGPEAEPGPDLGSVPEPSGSCTSASGPATCWLVLVLLLWCGLRARAPTSGGGRSAPWRRRCAPPEPTSAGGPRWAGARDGAPR